MGQRAYREKYTNSLVRDYMNNKNNSLEEQYFFSGKPKDVKFIFDLDDPLKDVDLNSINLNRGLINYVVPKNTKINNLNLIIKSNNFGEQITYLHSNLFCLFGTYFIKDISYINVSLYNPKREKCFNDRQLIKDILDFMCFKSIKLVKINRNLMYYVIPENSEFAIVLAFKEINYEESHKNFLLNLEDLIFHQYSKFADKLFNLKRCLAAVDKTIPKGVTNLILPTILVNLPCLEEVFNMKRKFEEENEKEEISQKINDYQGKENFENFGKFEEIKIDGNFNKENLHKNFIDLSIGKERGKFSENFIPKNRKIFENLNFFLKEIRNRNFKVISFELKLSLEDLDDYGNNPQNFKENEEDEFEDEKNKNEDFFSDEELELNNSPLDSFDTNDNTIEASESNNNSTSLISFENIYTETNAKNHGGPAPTKTHYLFKRKDKKGKGNDKERKFKSKAKSTKNLNNPLKLTKKEIQEEKKILKYSEQYIKLLEIFLDENIEVLKEFQQVVLSLDFDFKGKYNLKNSFAKRNKYIAYHFKKLIVKKNLENLTLIHHISFKMKNNQTLLEDQFDYLDYVFFMKETADDLYKKLFLFKHSRELSKISRKKNIMFKILSDYLFDFPNELFTEGRLDYSYQILKNMKIVPMQINADSSMIFMNN